MHGERRRSGAVDLEHGRREAAGEDGLVVGVEPPKLRVGVAARRQRRTWLAAIEGQTGRKPIIYTSTGTYPVNMTTFAAYPLWVANYGASCPSMPLGWSTWHFWQYSSTGSVNGIDAGNVDLDEFNGTLAELMAFGSGAPSDSGMPGMGDGSDRVVGEAGLPSDAGAVEPDAGLEDASGDGGGSAMGKAGGVLATTDASMTAGHTEANPCGP